MRSRKVREGVFQIAQEGFNEGDRSSGGFKEGEIKFSHREI